MLNPDPNKINLGVQHEKSQSKYHNRSHKKAEITSGDGGWVAAAEIEHSNLVYLLPGNTISQYA